MTEHTRTIFVDDVYFAEFGDLDGGAMPIDVLVAALLAKKDEADSACAVEVGRPPLRVVVEFVRDEYGCDQDCLRVSYVRSETDDERARRVAVEEEKARKLVAKLEAEAARAKRELDKARKALAGGKR